MSQAMRDLIRRGDCPECEGDGYLEKFNDDHSGVITWLCPACDGTGKKLPYEPTPEEWNDSMGGAG